ncbi:hypothetical protein [Nostoc sp. 'Lobaria pulmonaria (5183) cyanobiont']|uniref:hypothetical protein n=1 Tax=Nostoc sp. 'Lobaria pulmonaria (5183) cyanobiont' TaxID=1618022 RepID=UPI00131A35DB|nr:hypothetical protein [Nostoc sp. 'Lobaria pulmonaria (5183) cyanobiont']
MRENPCLQPLAVNVIFPDIFAHRRQHRQRRRRSQHLLVSHFQSVTKFRNSWYWCTSFDTTDLLIDRVC